MQLQLSYMYYWDFCPFNHQLFDFVAMEMQTPLRSDWMCIKKRPVPRHSWCDLALFPPLTSDAFCFLLPLFYAYTHTHLLPLYGGSLLDAAGRRWVSAWPGPGLGLYFDCLSFFVHFINGHLAPLANKDVHSLFLHLDLALCALFFSSFPVLFAPAVCWLKYENMLFSFSSPASRSLIISAADQSEQVTTQFVFFFK